MFNIITKKDAILKDLKKINLDDLEAIQNELTLLIDIRKKQELDNKLSHNEYVKSLKEKYDNDNYVCIYQPYDSNNWFIEKNPNFNDTNTFGTHINGFVTFVLKSELSKYGLN